jgi:hypothetical protein
VFKTISRPGPGGKIEDRLKGLADLSAGAAGAGCGLDATDCEDSAVGALDLLHPATSSHPKAIITHSVKRNILISPSEPLHVGSEARQSAIPSVLAD